MGSQGQENAWQARQQLADQVVPHLCTDKLRETIRELERPSNPGFQHREIKPQNF